MSDLDDAFFARRQRLSVRPNGHLYMRPNAGRFMPPSARRWESKDAARLFWPQPSTDHEVPNRGRARTLDQAVEREILLDLKAKVAALKDSVRLQRVLRDFKAGFNPNQPRVSAGNPDGGQWTSTGGRAAAPQNDPRILSDATPDNEWKPDAQYAQYRLASTPVRVNGVWLLPTPGQAARLSAAEAQAREVLSRVRELDPRWRPSPSAYTTIEGLIESHRADARQAQSRLDELSRVGIGPGPHAGESIPLDGPGRYITVQQRAEINRIGRLTGCHTCGTTEPGTRSSSFICDHQNPTALNQAGRPQRGYPHCITCSTAQGGHVTSLLRRH